MFVLQGGLLASFRGHKDYICLLSVSPDNALLASASCDKEIRVMRLF